MNTYTCHTKKILFYTAAAAIICIVVFPVYWLVTMSFKTPLEIILYNPTLYPHSPVLANYISIFRTAFLQNLFNSIFITACSACIAVCLGTGAAYALARHNFPFMFGSAFLIVVLIVKILPPIILGIPLYTMLSAFHLVNHLTALILTYQIYLLPYCIWMIFGFFKSLPPAFEDAAMIDGASRWYTFTRIAVPLCKPGITAAAVFSSITAWDEFLFAMLFLHSPEKQTLPAVVAGYIGEYETEWGQLAAAGILACIPLLCLINFVYRYYTESFSPDLK